MNPIQNKKALLESIEYKPPKKPWYSCFVCQKKELTEQEKIDRWQVDHIIHVRAISLIKGI
jgi:hypothetical protein